jgi:hypothetical protein
MTPEKQKVIETIRAAFKGVVLGNGVGLREGQGLDDYADKATRKAYRDKDEKTNWEAIPVESLNVCQSSLSFFDAEGMRFHLPAFLVADLSGTLGIDPVFHLTQVPEYDPSKLLLLSHLQRSAIREYLLLIKNDPDHEYDLPHIERSLDNYWTAD